jgi:hypothetical protein
MRTPRGAVFLAGRVGSGGTPIVVPREMATLDSPRSRSPGPVPWTALAGVLLFLRYPDWFLRPRLWAEDLPVFFVGARVEGPHAILSPYAGYIHLIPRLVAWLGAWLDPSRIPAFYLYSSLAITLLVVARAFSPRLGLPCKPVLALAIVAVPHTGEIFLNVTNIQWITALSLVLTLLMRDPESAPDWMGDVAVLLLAGLTGPFSVFLFPFFVLRALDRRTAASWWVLAAAGAPALVQGWHLYSNLRESLAGSSAGPMEYVNLVAVLSARLPLAFLGAQAWVDRLSRESVIAAGLIGAAAIIAMAVAGSAHRKERVCLLMFVCVLLAFTTARVREDLWDYREMVNGDRYFYIPKVLLLWVGLSFFWRRALASYSPAMLTAAAGLYCVSMIPYVDFGGHGARHVERPYYSWDIYCRQIRMGNEVAAEVSPGWKVVVPGRGLGR